MAGQIIESMLLVLACTALRPGQTTSDPLHPRLAPDARQSAIRQLSDARWSVREEAMSALLYGCDASCYDDLRAAFKTCGNYDARRRIREIAHVLYLTEQLGPPRAFLGITARQLDGGTGARSSARKGIGFKIPPGTAANYLDRVIHGSAAQRDGLRAGDLMLSMNGAFASTRADARALTMLIGEHKPGDVCTFGVLRGGIGLRLRLGEAGFLLADVTEATVRAVTHTDDARVPAGALALLVTGVSPRRIAGKLKTGDLILALDGQELPAADPVRALKDWIAFERGMQDDDSEVPNEAPPAESDPTMQVLRGGEWIEFVITLGHIPSHIRDNKLTYRGRWRAEDTRVIEAVEQDFKKWWGEAFDPEGLVGDEPQLGEWKSTDTRLRLRSLP